MGFSGRHGIATFALALAVVLGLVKGFDDFSNGTALEQEDACDNMIFAPRWLKTEYPRGPCSGHGVCEYDNAPTICSCEQGWNGKADFFNMEGLDCLTNNLHLRILWSINLVVCVGSYVVSYPRIKLRFQQHQEQAAHKKGQGKKYSVFTNRGLLAVASAFSLCLPGVVLTGAIVLIDPNQRVGLDLPVSISFAIAKVGFYFSVWLFQPALLSTILKGKKSASHIIKVNDIGSLILCTFAGALGFVPLVQYFTSNGQDQAATTAYLVVIGGTLLSVWFLFFQAVYVRREIIKVLDASYSTTKQARTQQIKDALVGVQKENIVQTTVQGSVYLLFLVNPPMWRMHQYFLPVSWIAYAILCKKVAFTTIANTSDSTNASSSTESKHGSKSENSSSVAASKHFGGPKTKIATDVASTSTVASSFRGLNKAAFEENIPSFHENPHDSEDAADEEDDYV